MRGFHNVTVNCWCYLDIFPACCKAVIKVHFLHLVQHSLICSCSRDAFVSRRVWRWKVRFFWGPSVAPAVFQVFALLGVAGGLRFLPRPRPDSVYRLQQRRLTATNCTWNGTNFSAEKLPNLSSAHEHCNITNSLHRVNQIQRSVFSTQTQPVACWMFLNINSAEMSFKLCVIFHCFAHQRINKINKKNLSWAVYS